MAASYLERLVALYRGGQASPDELQDLNCLLRCCAEARCELIRQNRADWLAGVRTPGVVVLRDGAGIGSAWTATTS